MRKLFLLVLVLLAALPAAAADLVVNGGMDSRINFSYERDIAFTGPVKSLSLSFVTPASFTSPTYSQKVERFHLDLVPPPDSRATETDARGNEIITATWNDPPDKVAVKLTVDAASGSRLEPLDTQAPFPLAGVPPAVRPYLGPTAQVQSDDPRILAKARELTANATIEAAAAKAIVDFVSDHVRYVNPPKRFDALYSLESGKGNCQNYSHLAAALMRAVGIPARIVNGFTMNKPYSVAHKTTVFTLKGGQGRHSWIEVYFPDLGWMPFDPLKTSLFVSTRYLRVEVGVDNQETGNDGRVRWSRPRDSKARPRLRTDTGAEFPLDKVAITGTFEPGGARTMVLLPEVRSEAVAVAALEKPSPAPAAPAKPKPAEPAAPKKPKPAPTAKPEKPAPAKPEPQAAAPAAEPGTPAPKTAKPQPAAPEAKRPEPPAPVAKKPEPAAPKAPAPEPALVPGPVEFGNLEFPENVDFTDYGDPKDMGRGEFELTRNFMVETAEYATGKMTQYAQVFSVDAPMDLEAVGLALHRYGGEGSLWVDVYRDEDGRPGELVAASDLKEVDSLSFAPGYRWADFAFTRDKPVLEPGMYWIGLGFTGDPVVNWFYTMGKPVGPIFGTRYKSVFDNDWSGALDFEFNYRIKGERTGKAPGDKVLDPGP